MASSVSATLFVGKLTGVESEKSSTSQVSKGDGAIAIHASACVSLPVHQTNAESVTLMSQEYW